MKKIILFFSFYKIYCLSNEEIIAISSQAPKVSYGNLTNEIPNSNSEEGLVRVEKSSDKTNCFNKCESNYGLDLMDECKRNCKNNVLMKDEILKEKDYSISNPFKK